VDLLALFAEDERDQCSFCGEKTCVTVPDAQASFCFACRAICLNGVRIDAKLTALRRRPTGRSTAIRRPGRDAAPRDSR
jgi:hypothetical protein